MEAKKVDKIATVIFYLISIFVVILLVISFIFILIVRMIEKRSEV